jgi:hypothetical protein
VLQSPYLVASVKSPVNSDLERNVKSLPVVCTGAAYVTHDYGSETYFPGQHPTNLWNCDYQIAISNDGKYCCVVSISEETVNLECAITSSKVFESGQTILLLDGEVTVNGIAFSGIRQFDLKERTVFETERAVLAWTVI